MKRIVAILVFLAASITMISPASAFVMGRYDWKRDCVLVTKGHNTAHGAVAQAMDFGTDCGTYRIKAVAVYTTAGDHVVSKRDRNPDDGSREFKSTDTVRYAKGNFRLARIEVFVGYQKRCHFYELTPDNNTHHLGSVACAG